MEPILGGVLGLDSLVLDEEEGFPFTILILIQKMF